MTCPARESLVPYALGHRDKLTARHISGCPLCQNEVARLREAARELRDDQTVESLQPTPECLDELTMADLLDGQLYAAARGKAVGPLASCAHCRRELSAISALSHETQGARPTERGRARRLSWRWTMPIGAVAAAILMMVVWPRLQEERAPRPTLREAIPGAQTSGAPTPIAPLKNVERVDRLVWSSVPHAMRYRVTVYEPDGTVRWATESRDTSVAITAAASVATGATYFWHVEAETVPERWIASELVDFRVVPRK